MGFDLWVLIIIILALITLAILWRLGIFTQKKVTPPNVEALIERARERTSWSNPIDVKNGKRNFCGIYTFPGTSPDDPGLTTFDTKTLNMLVPVMMAEEGCIDPDQLAAKQQMRTCLGNSASSSGGNTGNICLDASNNVYKKGEKQIFYLPCKVPKCTDEYGVIAINFDQDNFNETRCLTDENGLVVGKPCNLTDVNQLWRIQRTGPVPMNETPKPDKSGVYARLFKRDGENAGMCIVKNKETVGSQLKLGECSINSGFNWFLAPPVNLLINATIAELTVNSGGEFGIAFSFNLVGDDDFCLVPKLPQPRSSDKIEFLGCEEANEDGFLWVERGGFGGFVGTETVIHLETEGNSQKTRLRIEFADIDDRCLIPDGINFNQTIFFKTIVCTGSEGFVWDLETSIPGSQRITPQQLVYTATLGVPPDPDELLNFIQTKNPLSMKLDSNEKIVLAEFATDNKEVDQKVQIMDYQIFKIIRDTANTGNTGINFPFYQWT